MLFVKRGDRVEAEAAALEKARHPGVVEMVGLADGALRTRRVEGRPLAEMGRVSPEEVAGLAAAVASVLADLHDLGVVHGGLDATHVLVDTQGRPVLCSLGRGGEPEDDVAALGRLVSSLLATTQPDGSAPRGRGGRGMTVVQQPGALGGPSRGPTEGAGPVHPLGRLSRLGRLGGLSRSGRVGGRGRVSRAGRVGGLSRAGGLNGLSRGRRGGLARVSRAGGVGGLGRLGRSDGRGRMGRLGSMLAPPAGPALADLAAQAADPEPSRRPSARAFAAAVHQRVPTARLPARPPGPLLPLPPPPSRPRRHLASLVLLAGAAGIVLLVSLRAGGSAGRGDHRQTAVRRAPRHAAVTAPSMASTTSTPMAVRVWPAEPLDYRAGVLTVGDARYALGSAGDAVVAGDWACTGRTTVALLRPATGEVFTFDGWAAAGEELAARPVGLVAGATELRVADVDGDGCDDLQVMRPGHPPLSLEVAR